MTPKISLIVVGSVDINSDSTFQQDYNNFEIISAKTVKEGFMLSQGEYICFVDSNDKVKPEMLKNLYSCIKENEAEKIIDIVTGNYFAQNKNGTFHETGHCENLSICEGREYFTLIMTDKISPCFYGSLYRRDFLLKSGFLDYPDNLFIINCLLALNEPRVKFSGTVNYFSYNKLIDRVKVLHLVSEYIDSKNLPDYYRNLVSRQYSARFYDYICSNENSLSSKRKFALLYRDKIGSFEADKFGSYEKILLKLYRKVPRLMLIFEPMLNLLRRFKQRGSLKKKLYHYRQIKTLAARAKSLSQEKIIYLIGTADYSNIGDQAIALGEIKLLREILPDYEILEIESGVYDSNEKKIKSIISKQSTILITGGGFIGDLWLNGENLVRSVIINFPDNPVIILPQTIFFANPNGPEYEKTCEIYSSHKNLSVIAREKESFNEFLRIIPNDNKVFLLPDMALYIEEKFAPREKNKNVLLCLREDKESILTDSQQDQIKNFLLSQSCEIIYTSNIRGRGFTSRERREKVLSRLQEYHDVNLVISDRLHGMIMAVLAGTPVIALNNLTRKVEGVYKEWLANKINYVRFINDLNELPEAFDELTNKNILAQDYSAEYIYEFRQKLREIILNSQQKGKYFHER